MPLHVKHFPDVTAGEKPVLLLIHGLFGSLENLGGIARLLADDFDLYAIDLPNHGRSGHFDCTSLEAMAETVYTWIAAQGFGKLNILGHSLGGKVAMEIALLHPELVERLVVIDIAPVHYQPHHHDVFSGLLSIAPETLNSRKEADLQLQHHVPEVAVRSFLLKNLVKQEDGGFAWRMNLSTLHNDYAELIKGNRADSEFCGEVLFLKGGESDYIQRHHWQDIIEIFPNASVKIISDTGHWLHAEKPETVARLTKRFLLNES